jgi:hypothetical protein
MRIDLIKNLAIDYISDPNCWPHLWVSYEMVTKEEEQLFYKLICKK